MKTKKPGPVFAGLGRPPDPAKALVIHLRTVPPHGKTVSKVMEQVES